MVFSLVTNPFIYGLVYPFISGFRDKEPSSDFSVKKNCPFRVGLELILLKRIEELAQERYKKGIFLINTLKNRQDLILPKIFPDMLPAFNRLPIVFKDLNKKEAVEKRLRALGIETSRMYLKPLHYMFDLGYKEEDFPNATYFAKHLLTLPVHSKVRQKDLLRMIEVIQEL